ncbi:MAG: response regulator [Clostridiales bacterium]|nr:response regulator [Clostridiales bacterium]
MYTVIVADDEEEIRRALVRKTDWNALGFELIAEASNGAEALELTEKLGPDLLLTDIMMPFISGIELARQVREVRPSTQIAFLSGYEVFEFAKKAIQYNIISYLLKPISAEEMNRELVKIRRKIDEKFEQFRSTEQAKEHLDSISFVMPLVLDGYTHAHASENSGAIISEATRQGLMTPGVDISYCIAVTSLISKDGLNITSKAAINSLDIIFKKYLKHVSFFTDGRVVTLLYGTKRTLEKYLHIAVEDISQSVNRIMDCGCTIGISRIGDSITGLHELYAEAMNAISYKGENSSIRYISDVENDYFADIEKFEEFVSLEERFVRGGLVKEAGEAVDKLFADMDNAGRYKFSANFIVPSLTSAVYKILYSVVEKEHTDRLQAECPLQMSDMTGSIDNIRNYCRNLCVGAAALVEEQCKQSGSRHCELAKGIIDREFADPEISLVSVSRQIAVSPNYLSALISRETGSTFIELLTKRRMEEAVRLLDYPSLKVKDVAIKCGYTDQHYFSYSFRKETGMSPIQYKKRNETEENG